MMKPAYIFLLFIFIGTGCNDWLELEPIDDLVQDEYWQTKEDLEAVLMGAYVKFSSMDADMFVYGEIRADMIEPDNPSTSQRNIMDGNIEPNNTYCRWDDFYEVINYCNYVLEFADLVDERDPTLSIFQLEGYKSEAIFLRSLSYFYLVRIFKEVPFVIHSSQNDDQDFFLPKTADTTILRSIVEDLVEAKTYAENNYPLLTDNWGRATKSAINALLADISLWQFKYQECINYCNEIIDSDVYSLVSGAQWYSIFYPGNSLESIMEFQFNTGLGQENNTYDLCIEDERFRASIYAQEVLNVDETIRKDASYKPTNLQIWKYAGTDPDGKFRSSADLRDANWILYRLADILLMKAEALNQIGQEDAAMTIVNIIRLRARRNALAKPSSTNAIEDLILEERARELAYEGKRYFDLMRMGRRNDFQRKKDFINRILQNVTPSQFFVLTSKLNDPYGWYMPIHRDELEANINMEQNPYYESFTN